MWVKGNERRRRKEREEERVKVGDQYIHLNQQLTGLSSSSSPRKSVSFVSVLTDSGCYIPSCQCSHVQQQIGTLLSYRCQVWGGYSVMTVLQEVKLGKCDIINHTPGNIQLLEHHNINFIFKLRLGASLCYLVSWSVGLRTKSTVDLPLSDLLTTFGDRCTVLKLDLAFQMWIKMCQHNDFRE